MDVMEKRKALNRFCDENVCCAGCPLSGSECRCGRGASFMAEKYEEGYMTDEEINAAYDTVFLSPIAYDCNIEDSGNRTVFDTGAVRDIHEGKGRMDLLPWAAIMEVSKHCENGAVKYGEHNVDRGIPTHSLCDSAARHLAKYLDGWTDEPHLLAAAWNLLWAIQMTVKHPELVDTPWKENADAGKSSALITA